MASVLAIHRGFLITCTLCALHDESFKFGNINFILEATFRNADLTSKWWTSGPYWATRARINLIVSSLDIGAKTSSKSTPIRYTYPFTMSLALCLMTFSSLFFFNLNTHFKLMGLCPDGKLVDAHVLFFSIASRSFCMTSYHIISVTVSQ